MALKKLPGNTSHFCSLKKVSQVKNGFAIEFSQALADQVPEVIVSRHTYHYHSNYGSEKVDLEKIPVISQSLNAAKTILTITFAELTENRLYTVELNRTIDQQARPLMGNLFWYNLIKSKY
ncbi:hypothetical protein RS130_05085 [Paraglaciecola aquimarina]|uniref:SbsA Ig-like domain-containing protein n=1 Tax=Paraglaciecola aquimarina TaxID=1235557 RepID=A0ABU3STP5_9ALTE|nr:hypothetical protein [Paraglaciecola aquimarina]MDU0353386.1 hypothetical protein [Paraglaciecola aquimarina]